MREVLHATLTARPGAGRPRGALIRGPSGSGKSDLALRLMARGHRLVADDRVLAWTSGGRLFGRAPEPLRGLLEIRSQGVRSAEVLDAAEIVLVVDALAPGAEIERAAPRETVRLLGVELPRVRVRLLEASAPEQVEAALTTRRV